MARNSASPYELIKRPLITEKATTLSAENKYTFEVALDANKIELKEAFQLIFPGRVVKKVHTTKMYPKTKRVGRKVAYGTISKKAVFTIEGEPIELFTGV